MSDQPRSLTQKLNHDSATNSRQTVRFLTAAAIGAALLFLSGLTLTGTVIALVIATPVLVLFSPVLVPAGILIFLATAGFLFSGACSVAALVALNWIYNYVAGKHPPWADHVDYARMRIADKARDMKERARGYGHQKAQEATQGS
ncbi:hypothetical protein U1Q18_018863 [Sarracenia purpurea var. burkii]